MAAPVPARAPAFGAQGGAFGVQPIDQTLLQDSPQSLERKRRLAEAMLKAGSEYSPIQSWTQGMARVANSVMGGLESGWADKREMDGRAASNADIFNHDPDPGAAPAAGAAPGSRGSHIIPASKDTSWLPPVTGPQDAADQGGHGSGFVPAMRQVFGFEGGRLDADTNGTPSLYGINKKFHPEFDTEHGTRAQAAAIYKHDYWDAIGADNLPPALQTMAFDTAVISGVGRAQQFIKASGGDPAKFMQLRQAFQQHLLEKDPKTYSRFAGAWADRNATLLAGTQPQGGAEPAVADAQPGPGVVPQAPEAGAATAQNAPTAVTQKPNGTIVSNGSDNPYVNPSAPDPSTVAVPGAVPGAAPGTPGAGAPTATAGASDAPQPGMPVQPPPPQPLNLRDGSTAPGSNPPPLPPAAHPLVQAQAAQASLPPQPPVVPSSGAAAVAAARAGPQPTLPQAPVQTAQADDLPPMPDVSKPGPTMMDLARNNPHAARILRGIMSPYATEMGIKAGMEVLNQMVQREDPQYKMKLWNEIVEGKQKAAELAQMPLKGAQIEADIASKRSGIRKDDASIVESGDKHDAALHDRENWPTTDAKLGSEAEKAAADARKAGIDADAETAWVDIPSPQGAQDQRRWQVNTVTGVKQVRDPRISETEWEKQNATQDAELYKSYKEKGPDAQSTQRQLDVLDGALQSGNVPSGPGAGFLTTLREGLVGAGAMDGSKVAATEVVQKVQAMLASGLAKNLAARPTQFDFGTFLKAVPGLTQSPEGREYLSQVLRYNAKTEEDLALMADEYQHGPNGRDTAGFRRQVAGYFKQNAPPVLSEFLKQKAARDAQLITGNVTGGGGDSNTPETPRTDGKLHDIPPNIADHVKGITDERARTMAVQKLKDAGYNVDGL